MTHLEHTTFPPTVTLEDIPQATADLVQATPTLLLADHTQRKLQNHTQEQQCHINPTARRWPSFKIHNWTPLQNQTMILILKLLEPSPGSDKDLNEWRGKSSTNHYTIGLVSDCPTVTVHAGKGSRP